MPVRYTDLNFAINGVQDFVVRRRAPTLAQMALMFAVVLILAVSVTVSAIDRIALLAILFILFGAVGWYVLVQLMRSRDLLMATEFQNALFASALGINNKFCLIIRRDGNIVYLDPSFQSLFPEFVNRPRRTIDHLLDYGRVDMADRNKVFSAIERGIYEKAVFDIRGSDGTFHRIIMTIEPILRPSGFILLRGREYVEQRADKSEPPPGPSVFFNKSNITLFSHVMDTMNMGVYMTDPTGNVVYANPVLEQWLGYKEGEITAGSLTLQDIIYHGGKRTDTIEPDNYEGNVTMLLKTGGTAKGFINQKIIRNEQGKLLGCTALVHHIADQASDTKRKLW